MNRDRILALLLLAALLVSGYRPMFLSFLIGRRPARAAPLDGIDRRPLRERADSTPIELLQFLESVRGHTGHGDTVGLILAPPFDGFSYAYWRGSYILAGRPVLLPPSARSVCTARYVAAWKEPSPCGGPVVWEGFGGTLSRSAN